MSNGKSAQGRQRAGGETARQPRKTQYILIGVVVLIVIAAGIAMLASRSTDTSDTAAVPAGVDEDLGIPVGAASSPVIDIYEDFQCPICKMLEENVGPTIQQLADNGQAKVVYHIMSFLDLNLQNDSSARATNAAGCAQDQGAFVEYHKQVFENQPAVEGDGYTDEQLLNFGENAGVPDMGRFEECMKNDTFGGWVDRVERLGEDAQISGTPTVLVNGTRVDGGQAASAEEYWSNFIVNLTVAVQQAG
jgi:protein-disulfide isomerase